jgi:MarR family transcriptional regulator for hemolysin
MAGKRKAVVERDAFMELLQLSAAWSAVRRVLDQALHEHGVSSAQALALVAIVQAGEPPLLSHLAQLLVQEAQSLTSLADRLERRGWVRRVPDPRDRRAIHLELTDAGAATAARVQPVLVAAAGAVTRALDREKQQALAEGLVSLYEACRGQRGVRLPVLPYGDQ